MNDGWKTFTNFESNIPSPGTGKWNKWWRNFIDAAVASVPIVIAANNNFVVLRYVKSFN